MRLVEHAGDPSELRLKVKESVRGANRASTDLCGEGKERKGKEGTSVSTQWR